MSTGHTSSAAPASELSSVEAFNSFTYCLVLKLSSSGTLFTFSKCHYARWEQGVHGGNGGNFQLSE